MTSIDVPVRLAGCGVRVAVTTTVSVAARAGAEGRTKGREQKKISPRMTFSRDVLEPARGRVYRTIFRDCIAAPVTTRSCRHADSRLPPAHPDRKQDDGTRQVSWLSGSSPSVRLPKARWLQWPLDETLAGYSCG